MPNLRELRSIPDWPRQYPAAYAAMKGVLRLVREAYPALTSSIPVTLSPLLLDLITAAEGDRAAIARLAQQREALERVDPALLVDAFYVATETNPEAGVDLRGPL